MEENENKAEHVHDDKILYEVRYPDGDTVRMYARSIYYSDTTMSLINGNFKGGTIFVASLSSGVTITQVEEMNPNAVTLDAGRLCGCGGVGTHGVDHED